MTEYKTFSDHLHSVLDIYENNYGHSPKTIYLDNDWLETIKSDKDFYNEDYLNFIEFDDKKENQTLDCFGDINIQIITDGLNRWYKENLMTLFDLEPFIYIGNIIMTERDCFDVIKQRKQLYKDLSDSVIKRLRDSLN